MKIFNTMTKKKEEFVPLEEGKVKMYVCGPTVYNFIHIGNARPMIVFDTVRRYFEYKGYDVNYVSNFTDVDDKIIKKAIEEVTEVLGDDGRILVRESGTEPLIRVMVEAQTDEICHENVLKVVNLIKEKGYAVK